LRTIAAEQANAFLSNARKWERERWVCQRLLQGLNIPYRADEFAPAGEPPDVLFRDASFEVFFVLDEGRRLNDEWRDELQRRRSPFSLSQLVRREAKPRRIPANEFLLRLAPTLRKKAHNYKERGMDLGDLDIIAFASLKREVLDLNSHFPPPTEYLRQGWRSLSLVGPTFAPVPFAHPDAPDLPRSHLGPRHLLGVRQSVEGDSEAGLHQFLEMLRRNRGYDDGLPRKALIDAFRIIEDEDLVGAYRRKMASLLF